MYRKLTQEEKERLLILLHCEIIDVITEVAQDTKEISTFVYLNVLEKLVNLATCAQLGEVNTENFKAVMNAELEDYLD